MPVDKFGRMSDAKTRDTGVSLTYINNNYICSDGGTPVSGSIDMKGNTLYNVADPVNPQDVATKEYADNRTHVIAVHARYCGLLKYGEYQFKFGGGNFGKCEENIEEYEDFKGSTSGFLMPHSGRIKKIIMESLGVIDFNEVIEKISEKFGEEKVKNFKESFEAGEEITKFFDSDDPEKGVFNIVKFEKYLNKEDYPQPYYKPPRILSSILTDSCKGGIVSFSIDKLKMGLVFNCTYKNNETLRR